MANRRRPIVIRFCVDERENGMITAKMQQIKTKNRSAYCRKMCIDGYIIKRDLEGIDEIRKLIQEINKIGVNVNQIAHKVNETSNLYAPELQDLKKQVFDIWQLVKSTLSKVR